MISGIFKKAIEQARIQESGAPSSQVNQPQASSSSQQTSPVLSSASSFARAFASLANQNQGGLVNSQVENASPAPTGGVFSKLFRSILDRQKAEQEEIKQRPFQALSFANKTMNQPASLATQDEPNSGLVRKYMPNPSLRITK